MLAILSPHQLMAGLPDHILPDKSRYHFRNKGVYRFWKGREMRCEECETLDQAAACAWLDFRELRQRNRRAGNGGEAAKQVEQDLEREYKKALAKPHLHRGLRHQDEGYRLTPEDLETVYAHLATSV